MSETWDDWREANGCLFISEADMTAAAPVLKALLAGTYYESGADTVDKIGIWAKAAGVDCRAMEDAFQRTNDAG